MTATAESLDLHYQAATARWPAVPFSREAFRRHAGEPPPPHSVDLFLAGAAGHRIGVAWATLETDFGPPARRVLARQPIADFQVEDLWAEAIVRLMDQDRKRPPLEDGKHPALIIRYRGLVKLLNYLIVVSKRLAFERQRRRRESTGTMNDESFSAPADPAQDTPLENAQAGEIKLRLRAALAKAYAALSEEHQFIIAAVYRDGQLQKDAGAMLGWSPFKTTRELAKAVESLKRSLREVAQSDWNRDLVSAWEECWSACWQAVAKPAPQEMPRPAARQ